MRTSKIISGALATVMVASTLAIGGVSASAATVKKPTKVKAVNVTKGIKISWKKVKGAKKYKVYRGKKAIKTVKKAKYTDKKAKAGKTYKYCVKAIKGSEKSKASKKVKVTRLTKPVISSAKAVSNGIKLTWKKVKGAKKYQVFKKTTGKFAKVATVTGKVNYTDTKAESGTPTAYAVKAVNGKSKSVASKATAKVTYLAAVSAVKATTAKNQKTVTLSWAAVKGATGYKVTDNTGKTTDVKTTSFVVTPDAKNITVYNYSVVATKGSVKSIATPVKFGFVPEGSYKTVDGNVHAIVNLKVGESYTEGKVAADAVKAAAAGSSYEVTVVEGKDVVTLNDDLTFKAVKAGTAKIEIKFNKTVADLLNAALASEGYSFGNKLASGVAYVDVTVA